ncbi:MAG: tRNA-dihydrouridine synthase [SAR324 cluster bacterium]|nr:tRNA-dihydrouridine synthase [SAR324 cluster bacterium]
MFQTTKPIAALAPMDGITDRAYRLIVRRLNPEVVLYSEFTSINGIEHSDAVKSRIEFEAEELPLFVQLFGREPELYAKIAFETAKLNPTGIDINMGCPAKRIIRAGNGAALIKEPDLAFKIVEATVKACKDIPVTVKTRIGWDNSDHLIPFLKGLESAGAQAITLHGRTAKQAYRGEADWNPIYAAKEALSIPVLGNGDLKSHDQAISQLKNLDGYMIGRAALGDPWVFWNQEKREKITLKDKVAVMLEHFHLSRKFNNETKALIEFRKHISGYIKGFQDAKAMRLSLIASENEQEFTKNALLIA